MRNTSWHLLSGKILARLLAAVAVFVLAFASMPLCAAPEIALEDKLKAAIVVKLSKFIEWPHETADVSAPLTICLIGATPLASALAEVNGKTVHNRELKVLALNSSADHRVESCQILFLGLSDSTQMETLLHKIMAQPILTVSDIPGFAQEGGIIEIVQEEGHLGFNINLGNAKKKGITLSAQLLALAKIIE